MTDPRHDENESEETRQQTAVEPPRDLHWPADFEPTQRLQPAEAGAPDVPGGTSPSPAGPEPTQILPPPPTGPVVPPSAQAAEPARTPEPAHERKFSKVVAAATGVVLLGGLSGLAGAAVHDRITNDEARGPSISQSQTSLDAPSTSSLPAGEIEKVAQAVLPSTVVINVSGVRASGQGTGVVISADGTILTNNHVVEAAAERGTITVVFSNGTNAPATIVGRDPVTDVAVIKASGVSDLTPATLGSSRELRVGQRVIAIGSPFGLEATVTGGIISALNRPVSPGNPNSDNLTPTIFPAIQTDAAINPGNSGGPLVDLSGRVIGINSAISTGGSSSAGSIGLGFAIPIDLVRSVSEQILDGKTVEHARIGVIVEGATGSDNITGIGAIIGEVEAGSAGEDAGLRSGDIITAVDGHPVASGDALIATIRGYRPGDTVELTILRGKTNEIVSVELGSDAK